MLPEGNWITRRATAAAQIDLDCPRYRMRAATAPICIALPRTPRGQPRINLVEQIALRQRRNIPVIFNYPTPTWADIGAIGLVGRRAPRS